jgi:multicomponent Na+:H+ antiporter subunit D
MDIEQHLPILQVIVPLLFAPLIVLLQPRGLAWMATVAVCGLSFAIAVNLAMLVHDGQVLEYNLGGWQPPFGIALRVDALSALLLLIVTGAATVAALGCRESFNQQIEAHRQPLFFAAWLLLLAGLVGMVATADAFNIFVFMEISSLAGYILIAGGPDRRALLAVFKYLIMGTIGATFYLIGVGMVYMMTGTLNLDDMSRLIPGIADKTPIVFAAAFITIGLCLKAAMFPLHVWLPNAYTHAPHGVTVFMAACGTKVAIYVLVRFSFMVFQKGDLHHGLEFSMFLMPLGLLSIVVASAVAMFEGRLKRMLAFSSVAQMGYIFLGVSLLTNAGLTASFTHMFNHALAKGALFLSVACLSMRFWDLRIDQLAGAAKTMPLTCAAFLVGGLSLIGVPGTAGFISKWLLIQALMAEGELGLLMVGIVLISSLMAVVYIWRTIEVLYFKQPLKDPAATVVLAEAPILMLSVTLVTAFANILFGLLPDLPISLAAMAADILAGADQ